MVLTYGDVWQAGLRLRLVLNGLRFRERPYGDLNGNLGFGLRGVVRTLVYEASMFRSLTADINVDRNVVGEGLGHLALGGQRDPRHGRAGWHFCPMLCPSRTRRKRSALLHYKLLVRAV